jgi:hypothetical protein
MGPCFSLQLRRPTKKTQSNETQATVLHPMLTSYNFTHGPKLFLFSIITNFPFMAMMGGGEGALFFDMPKSNKY